MAPQPDRRPGLDAFAGSWTLRKRIADRRTGQISQFAGRAEFTWAGSELAYAETGELILSDGQRLAASRRYQWRGGAGGAIEVLFDGGRPFHRIGAEDAHFCDPDFYRVRYLFDAWPRWCAIWDVTGPRKDYQMVADYCR